MGFVGATLNSHIAFTEQHFPDGSSIERDSSGQIVRTCDTTGLKHEYSRQPFTGRLAIKMYGLWSNPDKAHLDESGTLVYQNGDIEIEKRLSGVSIIRNLRTGVVIQTDNLNRQELVKQPHGEIWKRTVDDKKEVFEIWLKGQLCFRSESDLEPMEMLLDTPSGKIVIPKAFYSQQSWENGIPTKTKISLKNNQTKDHSIAMNITVSGRHLALPSVNAVISIFNAGTAIETSYELSNPSRLKLIPDPRLREYPDIICVRNFLDAGNSALGLRNSRQHEHIPTLS